MKKNNFLEAKIELPAQAFSAQCLEDVGGVGQAASNAFGIRYLFPWQRLVIASIMDSASGQNSDCPNQIVLLPTGAGKSLCFLVPALLLQGPTLVVYPLLALVADQRRRMEEAGISSVTFCGGQAESEREENFRKIREGTRLILATPEILLCENLLGRLASCNIAHVAIDEAHCVSEWGDSFRPAYLELGKAIGRLNPRTATAFTATASPSVLERVSAVLFDGNARVLRGDCDRPNIKYYVHYTYAKKRAAVILALMEQRPAIIFCGTRLKSEDMARELAEVLGTQKVKFYHAGLSREEKAAVEKWFYPSTDGILCCTCAFGMGVDKKDVRTVIHLEPSETAESYVQEAGRGGRDGSVAKAILLWSPADSEKFAKFAPESRQAVIRKFAETHGCRRQILLDALGGEQAVCSGCDVCDGVRENSAGDADFVMEHVRLYKNCFNQDELCSELERNANRACLNLAGIGLWEYGDFEQILAQLGRESKIKTHRCFWKGRIYPSETAKSSGGRRLIFLPRLRLLHHRLLLEPSALVSAGREPFSASVSSASCGTMPHST